jgi:hypothetical protein
MPAFDLFPTAEIKKALIASGGLMSHAARMLGCSHATISLRVKDDPDLQQVIEAARELHIDDAENSLRQLVLDKDLGATIYSLKTIGKRRGYIEQEKNTSQEAINKALVEMARTNAFLVTGISPAPVEDIEGVINHNESIPEA